jgi:hypothetical protein
VRAERWKLFGLAALAAVLCHVCSAEPAGGQMRLSVFKTREQADDGSPRWELAGAEAVLQGNTVGMKEVRLVLHLADGGTARVRSPEAAFDRDTKTICSDADIQVVSDGFDLEGTGYDIATTLQRVHIRNDVHMLIRAAGGRPGGLRVPGVTRPADDHGDTQPEDDGMSGITNEEAGE